MPTWNDLFEPLTAEYRQMTEELDMDMDDEEHAAPSVDVQDTHDFARRELISAYRSHNINEANNLLNEIRRSGDTGIAPDPYFARLATRCVQYGPQAGATQLVYVRAWLRLIPHVRDTADSESFARTESWLRRLAYYVKHPERKTSRDPLALGSFQALARIAMAMVCKGHVVAAAQGFLAPLAYATYSPSSHVRPTLYAEAVWRACWRALLDGDGGQNAYERRYVLITHRCQMLRAYAADGRLALAVSGLRQLTNDLPAADLAHIAPFNYYWLMVRAVSHADWYLFQHVYEIARKSGVVVSGVAGGDAPAAQRLPTSPAVTTFRFVYDPRRVARESPLGNAPLSSGALSSGDSWDNAPVNASVNSVSASSAGGVPRANASALPDGASPDSAPLDSGAPSGSAPGALPPAQELWLLLKTTLDNASTHLEANISNLQDLDASHISLAHAIETQNIDLGLTSIADIVAQMTSPNSGLVANFLNMVRHLGEPAIADLTMLYILDFYAALANSKPLYDEEGSRGTSAIRLYLSQLFPRELARNLGVVAPASIGDDHAPHVMNAAPAEHKHDDVGHVHGIRYIIRLWFHAYVIAFLKQGDPLYALSLLARNLEMPQVTDPVARDWLAVPRTLDARLGLERDADSLEHAGRINIVLRFLQTPSQPLVDLIAEAALVLLAKKSVMGHTFDSFVELILARHDAAARLAHDTAAHQQHINAALANNEAPPPVSPPHPHAAILLNPHLRLTEWGLRSILHTYSGTRSTHDILALVTRVQRSGFAMSLAVFDILLKHMVYVHDVDCVVYVVGLLDKEQTRDTEQKIRDTEQTRDKEQTLDKASLDNAPLDNAPLDKDQTPGNAPLDKDQTPGNAPLDKAAPDPPVQDLLRTMVSHWRPTPEACSTPLTAATRPPHVSAFAGAVGVALELNRVADAERIVAALGSLYDGEPVLEELRTRVKLARGGAPAKHGIARRRKVYARPGTLFNLNDS